MGYEDQFKAAEQSGQTRTVTPKFVQFEKKGDRVIGRLKGTAEVPSQRGEGSYKQYLLDTDSGLIKFALGAATDKEIGPMLVLESLYCFTYEGKVKLEGGRTVNKFKVMTFEGPEEEPVGGAEDVPF